MVTNGACLFEHYMGHEEKHRLTWYTQESGRAKGTLGLHGSLPYRGLSAQAVRPPRPVVCHPAGNFSISSRALHTASAGSAAVATVSPHLQWTLRHSNPRVSPHRKGVPNSIVGAEGLSAAKKSRARIVVTSMHFLRRKIVGMAHTHLASVLSSRPYLPQRSAWPL